MIKIRFQRLFAAGFRLILTCIFELILVIDSKSFSLHKNTSRKNLSFTCCSFSSLINLKVNIFMYNLILMKNDSFSSTLLMQSTKSVNIVWRKFVVQKWKQLFTSFCFHSCKDVFVKIHLVCWLGFETFFEWMSSKLSTKRYSNPVFSIGNDLWNNATNWKYCWR